MTEEARRSILFPEAGSALARARDYGIDLTILLRNLTRTPEEILEAIERSQALARMTTRMCEDERRAE